MEFKSTVDLKENSQYKLIITVHNNLFAEGEFYYDDGESFNYKKVNIYSKKILKN